MVEEMPNELPYPNPIKIVPIHKLFKSLIINSINKNKMTSQQ